MKIKKLLFISMLFEFVSVGVSAQMMDLMGSMAVGGTMDAGSTKMIGTANQRLKSTQLMSDIQLNVVDIMTSSGGRYRRMKEREITSGGTKVTFRSTSDGHLEAYIHPLSVPLCQSLLTSRWDGATGLKVKSGNKNVDLTVGEASARATKACVDAKSMSIFFQ